MYKGKIDKLINETNKIARLKRISYKLENIYEEYDEYLKNSSREKDKARIPLVEEYMRNRK